MDNRKGKREEGGEEKGDSIYYGYYIKGVYKS